MTDIPNFMRPIQIKTVLSAPEHITQRSDAPRIFYPSNPAVNYINPTNPTSLANQQSSGINIGYYGKKKVAKMTAKANKWMQTIAHRGALHRQLGISDSQTIPTTLLRAIVDHSIGSVVKNPTKIGHKTYAVTSLLHARANAALNMRSH